MLCRFKCGPQRVLVPSNIVACFRVALVRKKIPEFSWLHCGSRHLVSHVTVRDRTVQFSSVHILEAGPCGPLFPDPMWLVVAVYMLVLLVPTGLLMVYCN